MVFACSPCNFCIGAADSSKLLVAVGCNHFKLFLDDYSAPLAHVERAAGFPL